MEQMKPLLPREAADRYGLVAILLHWAIALAIIGCWRWAR